MNLNLDKPNCTVFNSLLKIPECQSRHGEFNLSLHAGELNLSLHTSEFNLSHMPNPLDMNRTK